MSPEDQLYSLMYYIWRIGSPNPKELKNKNDNKFMLLLLIDDRIEKRNHHVNQMRDEKAIQNCKILFMIYSWKGFLFKKAYMNKRWWMFDVKRGSNWRRMQIEIIISSPFYMKKKKEKEKQRSSLQW